jgi:hypothetical protein
MKKIDLRIIVFMLLISCSSVPVYLAADTPIAKNPLYLCAGFESYTSCDGSAYHLEIDGKVFDNHRGVDWQAKAGTEIFSFGSGTIAFVAHNPCGGYRIVVRPKHYYDVMINGRRHTGRGFMTHQYSHLIPTEGLYKGKMVYAGMLLGKIATDKDNGNCAGDPHVHFQMVANWSLESVVDPLDFASNTCMQQTARGATIPDGKLALPCTKSQLESLLPKQAAELQNVDYGWCCPWDPGKNIP